MATTLGAALKASEEGFRGLPNVFLSYAPADLSRAERLASDLRRHSVKVWLDDDHLRAWEDRDPAVRTAIRATDAFLLLVSPESARSEIIGRELDFAIQHKKPLLPLQFEDATLPAHLQGKAPLNLQGDAYPEGLRKLTLGHSTSFLRAGRWRRRSPTRFASSFWRRARWKCSPSNSVASGGRSWTACGAPNSSSVSNSRMSGPCGPGI